MSRLLYTGSAVLVAVATLAGRPDLLDRVSPPNDAPIEQDTTASTRRLLADFDIDTRNAPRADGALMSVMDARTGDLALLDLETGTSRRIQVKRGDWETSESYVETSMLTPNGERIAYSWWDAATRIWSVRTVQADGSAERELLSDPAGGYMEVNGMLPDNRHAIVSVWHQEGRKDYQLLSLDNGSRRPIARNVIWWAQRFTVTPDGRFALYTPAHDRIANSPRSPMMLDLASGATWPLVSWHANDYGIGFSPDGRGAFVFSERAGTPGVWWQPITNGRATGTPRLVRADLWNTAPLAVTNRGRILYRVRVGTRQVMTAALDPVTGQRTGEPEPFSTRFVNGQSGVAIAPDGEWSVMSVPQREGALTGVPVLLLSNLRTGETRELPVAFRNVLGAPRWSPDASRFMVRAQDASWEWGLFAVDIRTGQQTRIVRRDTALAAPIPTELGWAADGRQAIYRLDLPDGTHTIHAYDFATQRTTLLAARPSAAAFVGRLGGISRDGRRLLGVQRGTAPGELVVALSDLDGANLRELRRIARPETIRGLTWSSDNRYVYLAVGPFIGNSGSAAGGSSAGRIERITVETGAVQPTGLTPVGNGIVMAAHPDHRRLSYISGEFKYELWALDNAVPSAR